jgi:hypothetical protein
MNYLTACKPARALWLFGNPMIIGKIQASVVISLLFGLLNLNHVIFQIGKSLDFQQLTRPLHAVK